MRPNPAASSILPRELNPSLETLASGCSCSRLLLLTQDYLKTVVPSQLLAERGANLVVINPGASPTAETLPPFRINRSTRLLDVHLGTNVSNSSSSAE